MRTAAIKTLGCKLNQYESEQLRERLERGGYVVVDYEAGADVCLINSCTVTGKTDSDARRLARRAKRLNPAAFVVMTGCYAQCAAEELGALPEIDLVVGNEGKADLIALLPPPDTASDIPADAAAIPPALISEFAGHTRCFVKVQEGCNAACTYCIIPRARGASRSVPFPEVLAQARLLGTHGHPEVVLIGTHLGQYGRDLPNCPDLAGLVRELCSLPEVQRLRLSSIEPREITPAVLDLTAAGGRALTGEGLPGAGKVCRHLHVPLQSGSDAVLQRMNRPYDTAFYRELVVRAAALDPALCLGADVIVGFPGETAAEFAETASFIESLPLAYLHVFSYSPRPQTPAADMPGQVQPEVKHQRSEVLRVLAEAKREAFAQSLVGQRVEAVIQGRTDAGEWLGITDNYLEIAIAGELAPDRRLVACEVTTAAGPRLRGCLVG